VAVVGTVTTLCYAGMILFERRKGEEGPDEKRKKASL
jgi:hypothetical protein